jgi:hypothetical protein
VDNLCITYWHDSCYADARAPYNVRARQQLSCQDWFSTSYPQVIHRRGAPSGAERRPTPDPQEPCQSGRASRRWRRWRWRAVPPRARKNRANPGAHHGGGGGGGGAPSHHGPARTVPIRARITAVAAVAVARGPATDPQEPCQSGRASRRWRRWRWRADHPLAR